MESGTEDAPLPLGTEPIDLTESADVTVPAQGAVLTVLIALSCSHMLNDTIQALIPSIYPLIKKAYQLNFTQIGLITFTFQMTGSLFQPMIGLYTDSRPKPYSLPIGMTMTLAGLIFLAFAPNYYSVIAAAGMIGLDSAIFHPEASRIARIASGGRHGFAQSLFQVGGNAGSALGPLLAALIIVPNGQRYLLCFCFLALLGIVILTKVGRWYFRKLSAGLPHAIRRPAHYKPLPRLTVIGSLFILMALVFSKFFYLVSFTSYYTFFLISKFHLSVQHSQLMLFMFLGSVALGTIVGGPVGDRLGRNRVIWLSILGVAPFSLVLPHMGIPGTIICSSIAGFILSSAFPTILVYATELVPGRIGLISGLFFGAAFGMAGIGAAILGKLADMTSIGFVYQVCSYLPLIGLFTFFLPNLDRKK